MEDIPGLNEMPEAGKRARPAPRAAPGPPPQPSGPQASAQRPAQASAAGTFDFNHPTVVALLYLAAPLVGITGLIGLILAYIWRGEPHAEWQTSHYTYLIRTFWMWLAALVAGIVLSVVVIGIFLILAGFIQAVVRAILVLVAAQKQQPMPNPESWLV